MTGLQRLIWWAPLSLGAAAVIATGARAEPETVPMSALKKCAEISALAPRLACYDQLAGREPAPAAATAALSEHTVTPPPGPATANSAAPAPTPPKQSFGLYSAEHPSVQRVESLTAKVIAMGSGSNGHPVVTLEGNQVWELDGGDPLLAVGDTVSIKRGTLGSFIMTTSAGRIHRLRRIR